VIAVKAHLLSQQATADPKMYFVAVNTRGFGHKSLSCLSMIVILNQPVPFRRYSIAKMHQLARYAVMPGC
jgi:hypothetical protein